MDNAEDGDRFLTVLNKFEYVHGEIRDLLDLVFEDRSTVFFYKTHTHFRQNRIARVGEGTLAFADKFKDRLVIPYMSSPSELRHLIAHEFTHVAQFEALYAGFWRSGRLIKGLSGLEPMWIMEGMAETVAYDILQEEWTSYDRMILRDAYLYDRLYTFRELQNFGPLYREVYLGYKQGHSAMDYLVETEGEQIHRRLLKSMRNNVDPLKAFEVAVTQFRGLRDFNQKWKEWLGGQVEEEVEGKDRARETYPSVVKNKYNNKNPVYASGGNFYYISDKWGKNEIYFHKEGNDEKILPTLFLSRADNLITGDRIYDRMIDYSPAAGILVFAARRNQRDYIYLYNTGTGNLEKFKPQLDEIRSPAISGDGTLVAFTARDGFDRNIYIYNTRTSEISTLTDDRYPDFGPVFSPGGDKIITASERYYRKDLRKIDIHSGEKEWITDTGHNDFHPVYLENDSIIYVSDKNRINNLYLRDLSSGETHALTDIESGAFYPHSAGGEIISSLYFDGSNKISKIPLTRKDASSGNEKKHEIDYEVQLSTGDITTHRARGRFSTDFFFPTFMYATDVGFIGGGAIRMSDYFAYNIVEAYGWGWTDSYEASLQYVSRKYRPDIFAALATDGAEFRRIENDEVKEFRRARHSAALGYTYPITIYTAFSHYIQASIHREKDLEEGVVSKYESDTGTGFGIERNTTLLEPFQVLRGYRLSLGAYLSRPLEKEGFDYNLYSMSARSYTPLLRNIILAKRAHLERIEREDAGEFPRRARLRGYPRNAFRATNAAAFSAEVRAMLFSHLNWHIPFMWPDLNIYSMSAKVFSDAGTAFEDDTLPQRAQEWGASWGFGLKLNFYLLQMSPGYLSVEFAAPYDDPDRWSTYWHFTGGHVRW